MASSTQDPAPAEPSDTSVKPSEEVEVSTDTQAPEVDVRGRDKDEAAVETKDGDKEETTEGKEESTPIQYSDDDAVDDDFPVFEGGQPRGKVTPPVTGDRGGRPPRPPRPVK